MAEWTLEEAAADLRTAATKLKTLPRRMRSGRRRSKRHPPLVKFILPPGPLPREDAKWCPAGETHCEPCREMCLSSSYARHAGLSPHVPVFPVEPPRDTAGGACILPSASAAPEGAFAHFVPSPSMNVLQQAPFSSIAAPMPLMVFQHTGRSSAVHERVPGNSQVCLSMPRYSLRPT